MNTEFYRNTMKRIQRGDQLRAVIEKQKSNTPIVTLSDMGLDGSYDEIRFGIAPLSVSDREIQVTPRRFKWCDYKKWDSSQSEFEWESRGEEIPFDDALRIWKHLDIGYAAE